ncbi:hypothetical protein MNBD_GAMMA09-2238 [hydrothermal vent metagenome]|uniref:Class I SAM-dependent methyltransferase n=1 Tax=hydrothermal vent metagenome TaxID=652676 RepID=A0A3B0XW44_9ZZZZ
MTLSTSLYENLKTELQLAHDLPVTPEWSAAADFLALIKGHCLSASPQTIVECSSGLSTLVLARCCQINNRGKVFSLENAEEYALQTQNNLQRFGLDSFAHVIHAPLQCTTIDNESYQWYETENLPDVKIDMLVIDGPPGFIQKYSRLPALPILLDQLSDVSAVFLDDAARDEEKYIVNKWLQISDVIKHEYIETERGCSILTIDKSRSINQQ